MRAHRCPPRRRLMPASALAVAVLRTASLSAQTPSTPPAAPATQTPAQTHPGTPGRPAERTAADVILGRELGNQGMSLAAKGDCAAAVDPLARSEALHHAPTTLTVLGECHIAIGALVQGVGELTRVVREDLDALAPPAYRAAQERARGHLAEAIARLPKLKIVVKGVDPSVPFTVTLDGEPLPSGSLGIERPVDPHPHRVDVSASGYKPTHEELDVREGGTQTLIVSLEPIGSSSPAPAAELHSAAEPEVESAPALHPGHTYVPAYVAFGVGALGVAVGTTFGVITLSKTSSLDSICRTRGACPASAQSDITSAQTASLVSSLGFGVGAAGALVGLYFAIWPVEKGASSTGLSAPPGRSIRPFIGLNSIGVEGTL